MIDVTELPKGGLLRFATLLENTGKKYARNELSNQWNVIKELASVADITISSRQIGLVRRVLSGKTIARGVVIEVFFRTSNEINIQSFIGEFLTDYLNRVELTFWKPVTEIRKERTKPLFLYSVIFDGYSDYYQNDTRKFMLNTFPKLVLKEGMNINPMQFALLYASDRVNQLVVERARGAEYMYFFAPDTREQRSKLIEIAETRKKIIWKRQKFWMGDVIGGI